MKLTRYISIILFTLFGLFLTGCTDDNTLVSEQPSDEAASSGEDDGMVDVTLSFTLDPSVFAKTRDGEGDEVIEATPSDLEDMDLFIYVLRDENNNILWQYGRGFVGFEGVYDPINDSQDVMLSKIKAAYPAFVKYQYQDDNNQTLMLVNWDKVVDDLDYEDDEEAENKTLANVSYKMRESIKLRVMRGSKFKFSCWTQSSKSTAYNFNYLTAVKVNYDEMTANSEINDAFCATSIFSIGQMNTNLSVMLTRPFAQINIAIDEKVLNPENDDDSGENDDNDGSNDDSGENDDNDDSNNKVNYINIGSEDDDYKYSKITLKGIYSAFDVIKNQVWTWEKIQQYRNRNDEEDSPYANYSDNLFTGINSEDDYHSEFKLHYALLPGFKQGESFTWNDLSELVVYDFSGWKSGDVPRKKYKKLSMAYVLVPDHENDDQSDTSTIILEEFRIAKAVVVQDENGEEIGEDENGEEIGEDEKIFQHNDEISVKRNWRTNLLFTKWPSWTNSKNQEQGTK